MMAMFQPVLTACLRIGFDMGCLRNERGAGGLAPLRVSVAGTIGRVSCSADFRKSSDGHGLLGDNAKSSRPCTFWFRCSSLEFSVSPVPVTDGQKVWP